MANVEFEVRGASGMSGDVRTAAVNRQRSVVTSDEVRQWNKEGRIYNAIDGVLTTPATWTAIDLVRQTPNVMIRVPAGMVVIPLFVNIAPEATGAAVLQVLISTCNNDPGTSNMTAATPICTNTRFAAIASRVNAYITGVGATGTAPTNVVDLFRHYQQVDNDAITGAPTPPIIYNPRFGMGQEAIIGSNIAVNAFLVYAVNGTSSTGFITFTWAEFTYAEFYGS